MALVMVGDSEGQALALALAAKCSDAQVRYHRLKFRLAAFGTKGCPFLGLHGEKRVARVQDGKVWRSPEGSV